MSDAAQPRDPFARYREVMAEHGFRPARRLGQNFLLDPSLHRVIADAVELGPRDLVLEVGAGLGFLTRELAARAGRVLAIEIDSRLCRILRAELDRLPGRERIRLFEGDALGPAGELNADLGAALSEGATVFERTLIVANLPYAVVGPLLGAVVAGSPTLPDALCLLVQREFAERLAAAPGSRRYGGISASVQAGYAVELLRTVPPDVFRPRPRVESAIVRLVRRAGGPLAGLGVGERRRLVRFVRALFGQRRKIVRRGYERALAELGLPPAPLPPALARRRAEELAADEIVGLWTRASKTLES